MDKLNQTDKAAHMCRFFVINNSATGFKIYINIHPVFYSQLISC